MSRAVRWKLVWDKFDDWCQSEERKSHCDACGHSTLFMEWEDQMKVIERLVERDLRRKT